MSRTTTELLRVLVGSLAMTGVACPIPFPGDPLPPDEAHDAGVPPGGLPLASSAMGFVDDPTTGVIGAWFAYGDGVGANANASGPDTNDSDCVKAGFSATDCSQIMSPTPGMPFPPSDAATSKMCTSGFAAQVMNMAGNPDYADLWGAGIGLDFNNPGGDAGVAGTFDMSPYAGIEFDFSSDVLPTGDMRVNFPFKSMHGTDSPYWGGASMAASNLTGTTASPQHVKITWDMVGGPYYLTQQTPAVTPPAFDPTQVQAIQLQVFTNTKTTTPYSFCVANLALFK